MVFDTGVVKLADFGLSKTLPINKHAEIGYLDSKFRLTGETGGAGGAGPRGAAGLLLGKGWQGGDGTGGLTCWAAAGEGLAGW